MMTHLSLLAHLYALSTQPPQTIQKPQKIEKYDDKAKKMLQKKAPTKTDQQRI